MTLAFNDPSSGASSGTQDPAPVRLSRSVVHRHPIRLVHLPLIGQLYQAAFRPRRRVAKRFIGKPARLLYRLARATGLQGRGVLSVQTGDGQCTFEFNARNTQFIPTEDAPYEPEVAVLLDILLNDEGVFFDVGANWGYFALYVLSRPGFRGTVHAFEAYPTTYRDLESTARQCSFGDRFVRHSVALSSSDGRTRMGLVDGVQSGLARVGGAENAVEVATRRLDSLELPQPDVIKIDVEGHEARVLEGARDSIARARPFIIFESWREQAHPATTLEPFAFLTGENYSIYVPVWIREDGHYCVGVSATNLSPQPSWRFGLVEIVQDHRFLLADQLNILACPAERTAELAQHFQA